MFRKLLKIPYYLLILGVVCMGLLLLASLLPIPGSLKIKIVKSGSMEPAIKTGGLVFIRENSSYKVGDIITFGQDTKTQIPTTHRIIEEKGEGASRTFVTMGDANDAPDPKDVSLRDIRGKVFFSLPYAGFVLDFAKKPMGFALLVGVPALIIICEELLNIWKEIKNIRRRKSQEDYDLTEALQEDKNTTPIDTTQYLYKNTLNNQSLYRNDNVLDLRKKFEEGKKEKLSFKNHNYSDSGFKVFVLLLITLLPILMVGNIGNTISYYNESELSVGNTLQASSDYGNIVVETVVLGISDFVPSLSEITEEPLIEESDVEEEIEETEETLPEEKVSEEEVEVVEEIEENVVVEDIVEVVSTEVETTPETALLE